ncbi:DUF6266 family protein [Microbacter margulisiae]|uniref:Uncharacterized protein n=1 Tax=Microbacter margulisiae TaxID=1350067 RepID=A0A7W5DQX1_9PORP|nr:DUF6266 family protein [Microbacter margulisiae]MBB3187376.1 hypothetical protein [Microbacter margulisiae]
MGKLNLGILSGFSGTVGTVVGTVSKNGNDVIRAKTKIRRTSNTESQVNQRTKFTLVTQFFQPVNTVLQIGLKNAAGEGMSPYNYACKQALEKAVTGTAPDVVLNYGAVVVSDGGLNRVSVASAEMGTGVINFHWEDNSSTGTGSPTDRAVLLVYNVDKQEVSYSFGMTTRSNGEGSLPLPYNETGDHLLMYLFFQAEDNPLQVSTSQYLGSVTV